MTTDRPSLDDVVAALPERPISVRELFRLTIGNAGELVFLATSTVPVEAGEQVATIAAHHGPTNHRYLVGWDTDAKAWIGLNEWAGESFDAYEFEYEIVDWRDQVNFESGI